MVRWLALLDLSKTYIQIKVFIKSHPQLLFIRNVLHFNWSEGLWYFLFCHEATKFHVAPSSKIRGKDDAMVLINLSLPNLQICNLQPHSANTTQISHTPTNCWTEECFQDIQFVWSVHQLHTIIVETAS